MSTNLKIQINMTLVLPTILYDSETWPHWKAEKTRLKVFERKILRKMYDPYVDTHTREWQERHNHERKELFQKPNITNGILKRRLTWERHT